MKKKIIFVICSVLVCLLSFGFVFFDDLEKAFAQDDYAQTDNYFYVDIQYDCITDNVNGLSFFFPFKVAIPTNINVKPILYQLTYYTMSNFPDSGFRYQPFNFDIDTSTDTIFHFNNFRMFAYRIVTIDNVKKIEIYNIQNLKSTIVIDYDNYINGLAQLDYIRKTPFYEPLSTQISFFYKTKNDTQITPIIDYNIGSFSLDTSNAHAVKLGTYDLDAGSYIGYYYLKGIALTNEDYNGAYASGYDYGYTTGYNTAYNTAYDIGYHEGLSVSEDTTLYTLFDAILSTEINAFSSLLNFDFMGVNLFDFVCSLITFVLLLKVVKLVL